MVVRGRKVQHTGILMVGTSKLVKGVGHNDVVGSTKNPFYRTWVDMLKRCYDKSYQERFPTYKDCHVCEEWLMFSNFKAWMEQQDWEGKYLDKDLLFRGNNVYSPKTCIFIRPLVNNFIVESNAKRGKYPLGVSFHKQTGKFQARCSNLSRGSKFLGMFSTPEEAHAAYLVGKAKLAEEIISAETDVRVINALKIRFNIAT